MSLVIETQQSCPNFERLKSELLKHPEGVVLYEDPIFQPKFTTLFNKQSRIDFTSPEIIWNRPGQLSKHPCLVSSKGLQNFKVLGGRLSPIWFPLLFSLIKERKLLELVVPDLNSQNTFSHNSSALPSNAMTYCGAFLFRFRRGGIVEDVVIDDRLPTTLNCHLMTAISTDVNEFLPALLEKAYAKFVGGYYNLEHQSYLTSLMDFTGGLLETISMKGYDILTKTEIESFFDKLSTMVGESFAICDISRDKLKGNPPRKSSEFYLINGATKIPAEPPNSFITSFNGNDTELITVVRMFSFNGEDSTDSRIIGRRLNEKWNLCSSIIRTKYGMICNDNRESWLPIEELPHVCNQVIIIHLLYRNAILAFAKNQEYWQYFLYEHFWHRDGPRGDIDSIGENFLNNRQYLCSINKFEGCNIKVVLTNTQKYVDSGANVIPMVRDTKIGICILEVERNRQYKLHSLSLARVIPYHVDSLIDRSLIISASLDIGRYVIIPWISSGSGTRYSIQLFSSALNTDFSPLTLDTPQEQLCVSCQFIQSVNDTKNTISSIYRNPSTQSLYNYSKRRASTRETELCKDCRSIYPKRATRISVLYLEILQSSNSYTFPTLYFTINCENEQYQSRTLLSTASPQWNEHYIFYRYNEPKSDVTVKVFTDGTFGVKSTMSTHTFSEKELREDGYFYICIEPPPTKDKVTAKCRLVIDIKNYLPSEFPGA